MGWTLGEPFLALLMCILPLVQLDLMPFEATHLAGSQPVAIGDEDHGRISVTVTRALAGTVHELLNLTLGEILPNCEGYSGWRASIGYLICHDKSPSGWYDWKDNGYSSQ